MTKVQIHFDLERPLDDHLLDCISAVHGVYGMGRVIPGTDLKHILVDFDASRLSPAEVEAILRRTGIPVKPRAASPAATA